MTDTKKYDLESLKEVFQEYLVVRSPVALPDSAKEFIVKITPVLLVLGIIFTIPAILTLLGFSAIALPVAALSGAKFSWMTLVSLLSLIVSLIFSFSVLALASKRAAKAWNMMYYYSWFIVATNVLAIDLGGALIGGFISFWFLFQLRNKYIN